MGSIPDEVTEFFNLPNPSSHTMTLGFSQSLIEMSTRKCFLVSEVRPVHNADNLTAICELSGKCAITSLWASKARYRVSFTFTIVVLKFCTIEVT
jgi:hypothetical protein